MVLTRNNLGKSAVLLTLMLVETIDRVQCLPYSYYYFTQRRDAYATEGRLYGILVVLIVCVHISENDGVTTNFIEMNEK